MAEPRKMRGRGRTRGALPLTDGQYKVMRKAIEDSKFWRALKKDPSKAMKESGIALTPEEMNSLVRVLETDAVPITLTQLMESFHGALDGMYRNRWPNPVRSPR